MIPLHGGGAEVASVFPADDLAHHVVGARVGSVYGGLARLAARAVVGEGAIHPAAGGVDGQPFWAVHFGGTQCVAGLARFDAHLALVGKAVSHRQWALAMHQWQPLACAIGVKFGDIQRAVV